MGGGDLNLKKSWHPSTYANLKRLWEAEQAASKEQQKLDQLRKEKEAERERDEMKRLQEAAGLITKQPERVEWLYAGSSAPSQSIAENYLLGNRRFDDKSPETRPPPQQAVSLEPTTKDLQEKLREDPLFSIKLNERMTESRPSGHRYMSKRDKDSTLPKRGDYARREYRRRSRSPDTRRSRRP